MKNAHDKSRILLFNILISRLFLFIVIGMVASSCSKAIYINATDVDAIRFVYLPKGVETLAIRDYRDVYGYSDVLKDTTIYNHQIIEQYIGYLNKLKVRKTQDNDFRIYSIIKFKNSKEYLHLGFGENYNTVVENQQMKDNPALLKWLHALLYSAPYELPNLPNGLVNDNPGAESEQEE